LSTSKYSSVSVPCPCCRSVSQPSYRCFLHACPPMTRIHPGPDAGSKDHEETREGKESIVRYNKTPKPQERNNLTTARAVYPIVAWNPGYQEKSKASASSSSSTFTTSRVARVIPLMWLYGMHRLETKDLSLLEVSKSAMRSPNLTTWNGIWSVYLSCGTLGQDVSVVEVLEGRRLIDFLLVCAYMYMVGSLFT
jgi:hypothetical protein